MPKAKHIVVDSELCCGCATCEMVCSTRHFGQSGVTYSAIRADANLIERTRFDVSVCRQCLSASCVAACPFDAMAFDEDTGARYIDNDLCRRCGMCVRACPFAGDAYPPIRQVGFGDSKRIVKCDLCHGFEDGPACVAYCPRGALKLA